MIATLADTTSGLAAMSLAAENDRVLTVEFKLNFLRPATDGRIVCRARVIRPGRRLSVMAADIFSLGDEGETLVATALATYSIIQDADTPEPLITASEGF